MTENTRADKWLWYVRIYKSRSLSAAACRGGKIKLNGELVKASKALKAGDMLSFKSGPVTKTIRVTGFPSNRIAAKFTHLYYEDLTPADEYEKLKVMKEKAPPVFYSGKGRPTKKDRRRLEEFF
ncbi:MAG TPA: RNA-binding S4 domain-containing protein [Bacteroidia bacterium]|nr:RNA-binding S4 domain-containing protein [Bacteroidia bacterium]